MSKTAPEPSPAIRPTLFHIALVVPWIALIVTAFERITDNSYLWHVRAGTLQAEMGSVLTTDPFSFTRSGMPWRTQSWLIELGYGWLEGRVGLSFTGVMIALVGAIAVVGIGLLAWRYSRSLPATAIVVLLSTVLLPQFLVPRPALFSYPLFVLIALAWDRPGQRWTVPLLFWIWASIHGSFAIGIVYVALRVIQDREWRTWKVLGASAIACLATAHGLGVVSMLWSFVEARPYLGLISEWQTPDFLQVDSIPILMGILLIIYGATKERLSPGVLWVVAPFLFLAVSAERAIGPAWIALIPIVAASLSGLVATWARGFRRPIAAAFVVLIILIPLLFVEPVEIDRERFPVEASRALSDAPTFHDDYSGGYLIWESGPERRVYIDDRAELYQEQLTVSVDVRAGRQDWVEVFARDGIEQVLLLASDPLSVSLVSSGWATVYSDQHYIVLRSPEAYKNGKGSAMRILSRFSVG